MSIAYSTNAFTRYGLEEALERIAALGFDGVEILCDQPHWFPDCRLQDRGLRRAERLRARLDRLGLAVSNLNCNTANGFFDPRPPENVFEPSLSSDNDAWRGWRLDYSIHALELAELLGARNISVTSGRPDSGGTPAQGLALLTDSLSRLCDAAERQGIRVGVEYEPGLLVERADELAQLIDRVGSPLLGANLDIGHSWLDGESPEHAVSRLAGRIWNTHVEDIRARKHFHLIPGEGDLPFRRYFDALSASGYQGFYTLELYTYPEMPDEAGRRSLEILRPLLGIDAADPGT
jgi:sugar phosphate isomerase/epimerase